MGEGFIVGNKGFSLRGIDWLDKEGDCNKVCCSKREGCAFTTTKEGKCAKNLISHCCKHVICGSEDERNIYKKVTGNDIIPNKIYKENLTVVDKYKNISQEVVNSAAVVGLSVFGKKVNAFCEGLEDYRGYCVYLSYEEPKKKDVSSGGLAGQEYGIVSMFYKNTELDSYWTLYSIYERYKKKEANIKGVMICPKVRDYYNRKGYSVEIPKFDMAMCKSSGFYPMGKEDGDFSIGALRYFYFSESINIREFYEKILDIYGDKGEKAISNPQEVIDNLKGVVIRNTKEYRGKIVRDYLDLVEGKPITIDTAFAKEEEKECYMLNFRSFLEKKGIIIEGADYYSVEMEICCSYFKQAKKDYASHILRKDELEDIVNEINREGKYVLSHADFSAFFIISSFFYYFMALCVFVSRYNRLSKEMKEIINREDGLCNIILSQGKAQKLEQYQNISEVLISEIKECKNKYLKIRNENNDFIKGWYEIFSSLFSVEEGYKRLEIRED